MKIILAAIALLMAPHVSSAATLYLKSGVTIQGDNVGRDGNVIYLNRNDEHITFSLRDVDVEKTFANSKERKRIFGKPSQTTEEGSSGTLPLTKSKSLQSSPPKGEATVSKSSPSGSVGVHRPGPTVQPPPSAGTLKPERILYILTYEVPTSLYNDSYKDFEVMLASLRFN